jgi:D-cysteine desulfhydrase
MPLFDMLPGLSRALPHVSLGDFPTPLTPAQRLGRQLELEALYIKRDDLSGPEYGGNKVRKLEFLLADALRCGAAEVLTFGYAGSNHATATAIYAKRLGMRGISMLLPQPNSHAVRRNLLASYRAGAELHEQATKLRLGLDTLRQSMRHGLSRGKRPYVIPAGGSSPLGMAGFVNAALELKRQIDDGLMPLPDVIYLPVGSMGSAAGLLIGLKLCGLSTRLAPIRVIDSATASPAAFKALTHRTWAFLRRCDASFPTVEFGDHAFDVRDDYFGERYALYTPEGVEAAELMHAREGILLDGTYTAKALAALIGDARAGRLAGKTVVFWNTYNSRDLSRGLSEIDYHELPRKFHRYFEEDVQPLDRRSDRS